MKLKNLIFTQYFRCCFIVTIILFASFAVPAKSNDIADPDTFQISSDSIATVMTDTSSFSAEEINVLLFHLKMLLDQQQYVIDKYLRIIIALSGIALLFLIFVFRWIYRRYTTPKFPVVKQKKGNHPGIVCIQMLCKFYGVRTNYRKLASQMKNESQNDLTMSDLANLAGKINFMAKGFKCDFKELAQDSYLPTIVYLPNHFAIVYRITDKYVYLADPCYGLVKMELFYFVSSWYIDPKSEKGVMLSIFPSNTLKIKNQVNLDLQKIDAQKEWNAKFWDSIVCSVEPAVE